MHYRKDIQILRGVSVLLVVLFHLGFTFFKSGFLGVDVFFVISGFLMAILYTHNNKKAFFSRRAKRLLPTYFVVTFLTVCVAIFMVAPNEYHQVISQSMYASGLSSNIGFWLQNSYFSKAEFNPLLHLWSLGVEIQFYLFIPILFFFFKLKPYFFALILMTTLLLCFVLLGMSPKTSFFMMPLRIWEFLIGYGVAHYFTNLGAVRFDKHRYLGTIGFVIILFIPLIHLDAEAMNFVEGHPGLYALLITLATGLVLIFGLLKHFEFSKLGTLLEKLGQYSYSIYLVHFPVIVLYLYQPFSGTILKIESLMDSVIIFSLIAFLSLAIYHFVEVGSKKVKNLYVYLWFAPLLVVATALMGNMVQDKLYSKKELLISSTFKDRDVYRCGKLNRILNPKSRYCKLTEFSNEVAAQRIMLIGNSHADTIKKTFAKEAMKVKSEVLFSVSNEPMFKGRITPKQIMQDAMEKNVDTIVLHYSFSKITRVLKNIETLVLLAEKENINVDFLMPVPYWDRHIPQALWENKYNDVVLPAKTIEEYRLNNEATLTYLNKIEAKNFKIYETAPSFCKDECAYQDEDGKPLYFDEGHLTLTGSAYLSELFGEIVKSHLK